MLVTTKSYHHNYFLSLFELLVRTLTLFIGTIFSYVRNRLQSSIFSRVFSSLPHVYGDPSHVLGAVVVNCRGMSECIRSPRISNCHWEKIAQNDLLYIHAGTSFGLKSGSNGPPFAPNPTSYDFNAPIRLGFISFHPFCNRLFRPLYFLLLVSF